MNFYTFLRSYLNPREAAMVVGVWYAFLLFLIFLGLHMTSGNFRYESI